MNPEHSGTPEAGHWTWCFGVKLLNELSVSSGLLLPRDYIPWEGTGEPLKKKQLTFLALAILQIKFISHFDKRFGNIN